MALSTLILLCSSLHHSSPSLTESLSPLNTNPPSLPPHPDHLTSSPLTSTKVLSDSVKLNILGISYKVESNGICTYCILEGIFKVNLIYVLLGQEDLLEKGQATHSSILGLLLWLRLPTPVFLGFFCDSAGKESSCD